MNPLPNAKKAVIAIPAGPETQHSWRPADGRGKGGLSFPEVRTDVRLLPLDISIDSPTAENGLEVNPKQRPTGEKMPMERRKHGRFVARGDSFATLQPRSKVLGQIVDVGPGGLAFRYIPHDVFPEQNNGTCELNILLADHSFYFDALPCRIASDCGIPKNEFGFSLLPMRRLSVQFVELSKEQIVQLEYFMRNHTGHHDESPSPQQ
jgi:hypothetical protein